MRLPLWRRRQQDELDEEIRGHLQTAEQDRIESGASPEEAALAARREFGNVDLVKEVTRDTWGWMSFERFRQDVRYALRAVWHAPGFAAVALLTLALGIGANVLIFSVVNAVVLRPLPFPRADRLVLVAAVNRRAGASAGSVSTSYPNFFDWRARSHAFEGMACFRRGRITLVADGRAEQVPGSVVSAGFFSVLGASFVKGRDIRRGEEAAGSDVAVIAEGLWRSRFGAANDIVGRTIRLNSRVFTVVGVVASAHAFPLTEPRSEIWISIAEDARTEQPGDTPMTAQRGADFLEVIGRLRPGVPLDAARADMQAVVSRLARDHPEDNSDQAVAMVVPELEHIVGATRYELTLLVAAVGFVLLIACANIANLLLARGVARRREMALRSALGAPAARLVRQLLTENLVLAIAGAALGLLLAYGSIPLVVRLSPTNVRGLGQAAIDGRVMAFAALAAIATAILSGLTPALQASRVDAAQGLAAGGRAGANRRQHRLRDAFVIVQAVLGVALLAGAGLMLRSFDNLTHVHPGFDTHNVVTARLKLPDAKYGYDQQVRFYRNLFPDLAALPGIDAVAAVAPLPLSGNALTLSFEEDGRPARRSDLPEAAFACISPDYFRAMRIDVTRGRNFTDRDDLNAPRVVIVNEAFARRYFPGEDPIGKRIKPGLSVNEPETPWREVVGLVRDVKLQRLSEDAVPGFYVPYPQGLITSLDLVIRTSRKPAGVADDVRKVLAARDGDLALGDTRTMDEYVDQSVAGTRFDALLLAVFGALGLVLTALGLYGVAANAMAERTREIAIRLALGATAREVLHGVLKRGCALAAAGIAGGLALAAVATRALRVLLYGVRPLDGWTFAAVAAVMFAVSLVACWIPARRATVVSPLTILRHE